jgi:hypothetical protein
MERRERYVGSSARDCSLKVTVPIASGAKYKKERVRMAAIRIQFINESHVVSDDEVRTTISALQTQVHRDFLPAWAVDADLSLVGQLG